MKTRYELDLKIYHSNLYYIQPTNFARYQHVKMINQKYRWICINEPLQYNIDENIFLWKETQNCFLKVEPINDRKMNIILDAASSWRI